MTPAVKAKDPDRRTYVVCLDCGKEFPYDWEQMKMVTSHAEIRNFVPSFAPKEAA
jgi:hypothetical protein